jgi:hypothetical protein
MRSFVVPFANFMAEDMLQCELAKQHCLMLASPHGAK